jgi:hypothetical protein
MGQFGAPFVGRRIAITAVICLLIGMVVTVLISWLLAVTVDVYATRADDALTPRGEWHWSVHRHAGIGSTRIESMWRHQEHPGRTIVSADTLAPRWAGIDKPPQERGIIHLNRLIDARGWPWLAFSSDVRRVIVSEPRTVTTDELVNGIRVPVAEWNILRWAGSPPSPSFMSPRVLPLRPIWRGFMLNSLLYGGLIWLAFFGRPMWTQARRRRRGQCPACGYPTGTSPRCSECGGMIER